jgi:hypothetical protein
MAYTKVSNGEKIRVHMMTQKHLGCKKLDESREKG